MNNFRRVFTYDKSINWFPGHMAKGLRLISEKLKNVQVVIEFEPIVQHKDRLIVYNKSDLAHPDTETVITKAFKEHKNQDVVFTNANEDVNVKGIIQYLASKAKPTLNASNEELATTVMVVGMPNVGKSSLINSLRRIGVRKGKAAPTGAIPGITRTVAGTIKVLDSPKVYLIDTPGVMIPHIADPVAAIKVALTGAISDHLSDEEVIVDYLLYQLNQVQDFRYVQLYNVREPTDDIREFLPQVAKYIGALKKGGEYNLPLAAQFLLKQYRQGKLGRHTLDDLSPESLQQYLTRSEDDNDDPTKQSRRQQKKAKKLEERRLRRLVQAQKQAQHESGERASRL
ncbi:Mitochondrial GTPase [Actinomortierella wolfii]|nr:Mitochondrial GTPase [Actinomortierella wolfii]